MNAETKTELAAVASTDIATLPPAARAAVVLKREETRKHLAELVTKSAGILVVTNVDGRDECHAAYMVLKNTRCNITNFAEAATEDAKKFTKAVKTEADTLIAISAAEEARLKKLRDDFDAQVEAERQAKIAAERLRTDTIKSCIATIAEAPVRHLGNNSTALAEAVAHFTDLPVLESVYMEFTSDAKSALVTTLAKLIEMRDTTLAAEKAEAKRLADIEAGNKRIAEERAELARQMAQAAERNRIESERLAVERAKAEQEAAAARLAIQQEQARLAEVAAEQEREAAAVRAEADRIAKLEAQRVKAEQDKAAAAIQAQHDELARKEAEFNAKLQAVADEKARADAAADEQVKVMLAEPIVLADLPPPESYPTDSLPAPDAEMLVTLVMGEYDADYETALGWLAAADFASLVRMA